MAAGTATGWALRGLESSFVGDVDRAVGEWFVDQREPPWVGASHRTNVAGDAGGVILVAVLTAGAAAVRWRRGAEAAFVGAALALQVSTYLAITVLVQRARPPVQPLDEPPPTGAFPSGHAASAAMLWLTVAVLVFAATGRAWPRGLAVALAVVMPVAISAGRLLRGAHALTDVVAGLALGVAVVCAISGVARRDGWAPGRSRGD